MKRKPQQEETEYKKGITIDTNLHQIVAIVVMFLVMFVLPVQAYTIYKNNSAPKTATYTTQSEGVTAQSSGSSVLGAFDSVIPSSSKSSSSLGTYLLYGGIIGIILLVILFIAVILK